jgi:MHS family proline/betaine transporter-like MFS transporter
VASTPDLAAARGEPAPGQGRTAILGSSVGNFVEWYDYGLYGYYASVFATLFFPEGNRVAALLGAFAIFGVAFGVRPLGALFFGSYGDRHGRRNTLVAVVLLISLATALVGVLPTYASIGLAAPVLLLLMRLLQGFSAGGEFGGATSILAEFAPAHRRGFYGSWQGFTQGLAPLVVAVMGWLLAAGLSEEDFQGWGWRIPFLMAAPLGIAGLFLRLRLEETPEFRRLREREEVPQAPVREMVRNHRGSILRGIGLIVGWTTSIYTFIIYMPTYLTETLGLSFGRSLLVNAIGLVVHTAVIPFIAILSDRVGRRPPVIAGALATLLLAYPGYALMGTGSLPVIIAVQIVFGLCVACFASVLPAALSELFPTRTRYSGLSLTYSLGVGIFGGLAPIVSTLLLNATGDDRAVAYYVTGGGLVALLTVLFAVRETAHTPLAER